MLHQQSLLLYQHLLMQLHCTMHMHGAHLVIADVAIPTTVLTMPDSYIKIKQTSLMTEESIYFVS